MMGVAEIHNSPGSMTPVDHDASLEEIAKASEPFAPSAEVHSYRHVAPLVRFVEVNNTFTPTNVPEPVDDLGVSASSVEWNNFERFLDEDRMWGVHRPTTRKPSTISRKMIGKEEIISTMKSDEKDGEEVVAGVSTAVVDAPVGAVQCTSPNALQPDGTISQQEKPKKKAHRGCRGRRKNRKGPKSNQTTPTDTVRSADPVAVVAATPDIVDSCHDTIPKTDCDAQKPSTPEIAIMEPSKSLPDDADADDTQPVPQPNGHIPWAKALPPYRSLYTYSYLAMNQEDIRNVWITTVLQRPGYTVQYVRLSCGFWYIFEDMTNVRMMFKEEYEDFVQWISEVNPTGELSVRHNEPENNESKNNEPQVNEPQIDEPQGSKTQDIEPENDEPQGSATQNNKSQHIEPKLDETNRPSQPSPTSTPKPADQEVKRAEALENAKADSATITEEEVDEEEDDDWPVIPEWQKRYQLGRRWSIQKAFSHPEFADRRYVLGTNNRWYFEYNGKFRRLMDEELALFNKRRVALFISRRKGKTGKGIGEMKELPITGADRWGLETIMESDEEE